METSDPNDLLSRLGNLGGISEDKARALLDEVCDDGIASRAEAEAILNINRKMDNIFPDWDRQFCILIKDYLLTAEEPIGWIDAGECRWLAGQISPFSAEAKRNEFQLLLDILPHADTAPTKLLQCALDALVAVARRSGRMTTDLVDDLRTILLHAAPGRMPWITKWEARSLLKLNDIIGFARNADSWNVLYARALANYLVAAAHPAPENNVADLDRKRWLNTDTEAELGGAYLLGIQSDDEGTWFERMSPSRLRAASAHSKARASAAEPTAPAKDDNWLVERLGWNEQSATLADRTLIDFFNTHAPGFALGMTVAANPAQPVSEMALS